jgi:hypothetical protein
MEGYYIMMDLVSSAGHPLIEWWLISRLLQGAWHWGRMGRRRNNILFGNSLDISKTETEVNTRTDLGTQDVRMGSGQIWPGIEPRTNFSSAELVYTEVVG